jgi:hypothetical protein
MKKLDARIQALEEQAGRTQRSPLALFAASLEVARAIRHGTREPALEKFRDWLANNASEPCPIRREVLAATAKRLSLIALETICHDSAFWQPARPSWGNGSSLIAFTVAAAQPGGNS